MEIWKDIKGYKDYEVSSYGNVRSLKFNRIKLLTHIKDKYGYLKNGIYSNGKMKKILVHRLVALEFIPNLKNKPQVNHINGIKTDNRVENLEWNTAKENINHAVLNGLHKSLKGVKQNGCKLTEKKVLEIRKINNSLSQKEISIKFGITQPLVSSILKNKIWKHI